MKALLRSGLAGFFALSMTVATPAVAHNHSQAQAEKFPANPLTEQILFMTTAAEIALQRGEVVPAWDAYLDLAKMTGDSRFAQRALEIGLSAQWPEKAYRSAKLWRKLSPRSEDAKQVLLFLLVQQNKWDEFTPLARAELDRLPENKRAAALLNLQQQLNSSTDKVGAAAIFASLVKSIKPQAQTQFALAHTYLQANQNKLAQQTLESALKLNPHYSPAILTLASLYLQNGEAVAAQTLLMRLVKDSQKMHDANARRTEQLTYQLLARVSEQQKDFVAAHEWLTKITATDLYPMAQVQRAQLFLKEGKVDEAKKVFQGLRQKTDLTEMQQAEIAQAEVALLVEAKFYDAAVAQLEAQIKAHPDDPKLLFDLGMVRERMAQYAEMESVLRRALKLEPKMAPALNALGYSLADRNERLTEARQLIEQALTLQPNDPYVLDSMGWVEYRLGKLSEAKALLQRAFANKPEAEIGAHLGEVLWAMGEVDNARVIWRQAQRLDAANNTLKKTVERFLKPGELLN